MSDQMKDKSLAVTSKTQIFRLDLKFIECKTKKELGRSF